MRIRILATVFALAACPSLRAEYALLTNGFRMHIEKHETTDAGLLRLYLVGGGTADIAPSQVASFEAEEKTPEPVPPVEMKPLPPPPSTMEEAIRAASAKHGLDPDLIRSMVKVESAGNPRAVSPKGAAGLMQLMPDTARSLGVTDRFDAASNLDGGAAYIRQLIERYGKDLTLALAAYNAGPARVDAHHSVPAIRETNDYLYRVITLYNKEKSK